MGRFEKPIGGAVQTDAEGHFTLAGLVLGQTYHLTLELDRQGFRVVTQVTPKGPGPIDLGELRVDTVLNRPYVPPTPEQRDGQRLFEPSVDSTDNPEKQPAGRGASRTYSAPLAVRPARRRSVYRPLSRVLRRARADREREQSQGRSTPSQ